MKIYILVLSTNAELSKHIMSELDLVYGKAVILCRVDELPSIIMGKINPEPVNIIIDENEDYLNRIEGVLEELKKMKIEIIGQ